MVNEVLNYSAAVEMLRVPLIVRQTTFFLELEKGPSEGSKHGIMGTGIPNKFTHL